MALILAALLLLAAACGDGGGEGQETPALESTPITPAAEGTPETPTADVTPETPTAEATPGTPSPTGQLPQDFPEEFPLYPDATVSQTARFGDLALVQLETDDSRREVAAFFEDALEEAPWEVRLVREETQQGIVIITFAHLEKPINGSVSIISTAVDGSATVISVRFTGLEPIGSPLPRAPLTPTSEEGGGAGS